MTHIGHRIKELREAKGLKLNQLAKASRTSSGYLNRIEKSDRNTNIGDTVLARIAEALETTPDAIRAPEQQSPSVSHEGSQP